MTWEDVVSAAKALPGVEPASSHGAPALRVGGRILTRLQPAEGSLVLDKIGFKERAMLIAAEPSMFHVTPHFETHEVVLVRLAAADSLTIVRLLERRWRDLVNRRPCADPLRRRPSLRRPGATPA